MPLRETATLIKPKGTGFDCGVSRLRGKLSGDDLEWFNEQLEADTKHQWISDVLNAEGHKLSAGVIGAHRSGRCRCES